jgi:hypothetical protein
MLGNKHFYNRTIRKIVVAFGTMFNDIELVRFDRSGNAHQKFSVPLSYGAKEKYITRITSDPNLTKTINTLVPRMSFSMDSISYDASRKQITTLNTFSYSPTEGLKTQYLPVPYNFDFSLSIYVRNTEDGTQILEQILPFFSPDFTVTVDFIPEMGKKYDMPVILNSVNTTVDYEGDMLTTRLIIWDLTFTVKSFIWPPVKSDNLQGLIGTYSSVGGPDGTGGYGAAITNIYTDLQEKTLQEVTVDYASGNGVFALGETIRVPEKGLHGEVIYFSNNNTGLLIVGNLNKLIEPDDVVVGDYSNAKYTVLSVVEAPVKQVTVISKLDPEDANIDDDYGFSDTIIEYNTGYKEP